MTEQSDTIILGILAHFSHFPFLLIALIFLPSRYRTHIPAAQIKLLMIMGRYIQLPGNHGLGYQDRETIGKCKILVATTSIRTPQVGSAGTEPAAVNTAMEVATINTLKPK
jgi:hypothetical protein